MANNNPTQPQLLHTDNNNPTLDTELLSSGTMKIPGMDNNLTLDTDKSALDTDNKCNPILLQLLHTDNNLTLDMDNNNLATLLLQ